MKSILVIHPEGNTFNNPTTQSLLDMLLSKGVKVSLMGNGIKSNLLQYREVDFFPWGGARARLNHFILNKLSSSLLTFLYLRLWAFLHSRTYDLIVGIDREGVIFSHHLSQFKRIPHVMFSFEILFENETSKHFKSLEIGACKDLSLWFIQDAKRAELLGSENGLKGIPLRLIPLASNGLGREPDLRLRDALGISPDKKVAMFMGSLAPWTMAIEILETLGEWPDDWCLILHERYGDTLEFVKKNKYISEFLTNRRLYISRDAPESVDDLGYILNGVNVGLAFYKPDYSGPFTGKNIEHIGYASGKVSTFLRWGIPVISSDLGEISDLASQNGFGITIQSVSELPAELAANGDSFIKGAAVDFFKTRLDFKNYETALWEDLNKISKGLIC